MYLGLDAVAEEEAPRQQHASEVQVRPIESFCIPPSPSPMLEAV